VRQLGDEVVAGRSSLRQATQTLLAERSRLRHFDPLPVLRIIHHGHTDDACVTAQLVRMVGLALHSPATNPKLLARLEREFTQLYDRPLPQSARETHLPRHDGAL
jgi:hypothetical protein